MCVPGDNFLSIACVRLIKYAKQLYYSNGSTHDTNTCQNTTQHSRNTQVTHSIKPRLVIQENDNLNFIHAAEAASTSLLHLSTLVSHPPMISLRYHPLMPSHHAQTINVANLKHHGSSRSEKAKQAHVRFCFRWTHNPLFKRSSDTYH